MEFSSHPALATLGLSETVSGVHDGAWVDAAKLGGKAHQVMNPSTGKPVCTVQLGTAADVERAVANAHAAYKKFRSVPAPVRGELVRRIGDAMRKFKVRRDATRAKSAAFSPNGRAVRARRRHHHRDGQDPRRGRGRGPGGHRHVRPRRRLLAHGGRVRSRRCNGPRPHLGGGRDCAAGKPRKARGRAWPSVPRSFFLLPCRKSQSRQRRSPPRGRDAV